MPGTAFFFTETFPDASWLGAFSYSSFAERSDVKLVELTSKIVLLRFSPGFLLELTITIGTILDSKLTYNNFY